MTTWIFQGNPDQFDLDGYVRTYDDVAWRTPQPMVRSALVIGLVVTTVVFAACATPHATPNAPRPAGMQPSVSPSVAVPFRSDRPATVCAYLEGRGFHAGEWSDMWGDGVEFGALNGTVLLGDDAPPNAPNSLDYHVSGTRDRVTKMWTMLTAWRHNSSRTPLDLWLVADCTRDLVERGVGVQLPDAADRAIRSGQSGRWNLGGVTLTTTREDWESGLGHRYRAIIE